LDSTQPYSIRLKQTKHLCSINFTHCKWCTKLVCIACRCWIEYDSVFL